VDILTEINLKHFLAHHQQENSLITVAVSERETSRYLLFNKYNRLVGWRNKDTGDEKIVIQAKDIFEKAYSGLAIFQPEALDLITLRGKFSLIDAYLQLAPQNKIAAYDHTGERLIDVGKQESVRLAEQMFA
jgi:NDP-sugar pyrophosphorylase family protein